MAKAVRRDMHKMTRLPPLPAGDRRARLSTSSRGSSREHLILRAQRRLLRRPFRRDALVDPHAAGRDALGRDRNCRSRPAFPAKTRRASDALDDWWRTYYRATFNPARANLERDAGRNAEEVLAQPARDRADPGPARRSRRPHAADGRGAADRAASPRKASTCRRRSRRRRSPKPHALRAKPPSIASAARSTRTRRKPCSAKARPHAALVFVGEQPGDQEDLAGKPFVGPAGQLFDRALGEAGIDRSRVYVTNAVKHFKFEPRGKRRIHKKPNNTEIDTCRWWLDNELRLLKPQFTVRAGRQRRPARSPAATRPSRATRGTADAAARGRRGLHHGAPLVPAAAARRGRPRRGSTRRFVADLKLVAQHLPEIRRRRSAAVVLTPRRRRVGGCRRREARERGRKGSLASG